jgi:hypothetical protein
MSAIIRRLTGSFGILRGALIAGDYPCADFRHDPLAHPAIDRMSLTELADIPATELRARGRT